MNIVFLSLDEVLFLHQEQNKRFGGLSGIRDQGLLESALAMPQAQFSENFLHQDIFEMASAYLFHIVKNHPFLDANKRTGAQAAHVFLRINDIKLTAPSKEFETLTFRAANGELGKPNIAKFFRENSTEV